MALRVPELLAPAGGFDALLSAVAAGADAVYTGLSAFNARVSAKGMDARELRRGCAYAHAHGARVYVTLNVFVGDDELGGAVRLGRLALEAGADGLIVADLGLAATLRAEIPTAEIHLSTQAGAHSPEALRLAARELGATRVCVARELPLDEIGALCASGVDVETFVHGAICISYSGACSYSALRRGRSAMRGDCTQPCRMSYGLVDAGGRDVACAPGDKLLCPKDYLGIRHVTELARRGVAALKIEGRMKNPDYVYNVVGCYRAALDAVREGRAYDADALESQLARSFNRGFSEEYLEGRSGAALMSFERSCNQGVRVGRLVACGYNEVTLELSRAVHEGDTLEIRFYPGEDAPSDVPKRWPMVPCPLDAEAGECIVVRCKRKVEVGCEVYCTRDVRVLDEAAHAFEVARIEEAELNAEIIAADDKDASGEDAHRAAHDGTDAVTWEPSRGLSVDESGLSETVRVPVAMTPRDAELLLEKGEVAAYAWCIAEDRLAWERLLPRLTIILDETLRAGEAEEALDLARAAERVVCRNIGQVELLRTQDGVIFDVGAPVFVSNAATMTLLDKLGAARIWLPDEWRVASVDAGNASVAGAGACPMVRPLGARQLMVLEHCLLAAEGPCDGACASCSRRHEPRFLVDKRDGACHEVCVDRHGRTRIFEGAVPQDKPAEVR